MHMTQIRSHTGQPGSLMKGKVEIGQVLVGNGLEGSEF